MILVPASPIITQLHRVPISGRILTLSYLFINCTAPGTIGVLVWVIRKTPVTRAIGVFTFSVFPVPPSSVLS